MAAPPSRLFLPALVSAAALTMTVLGSCSMPARPAPPPAPVAAPAPPPLPEPVEPFVLQLEGVAIQGGTMRGHIPSGATALTLGGEPVSFDRDGKFLIAFDRDAQPQAMLRAEYEDGRTLSRDIAIAPRDWDIERVNIARSSSGPSASFMELRRPELAAINAARRVRSDSIGWRQDFIWPVKGRISGMFGSQRIYRGEPGSYHTGIDIATGTSGTPIVAPADGTVILATDQPFTLEGNLLMLDHGMGLNSAFLHLSEIAVASGDTVKQGDYIGRIGSTGRATGPHLHWSMKWHVARIDPILLTGPME